MRVELETEAPPIACDLQLSYAMRPESRRRALCFLFATSATLWAIQFIAAPLLVLPAA